MRTDNFRRLASLVAGLAISASDARSLCQVPQPRLVCAEFANSRAVVIARLLTIRMVGDGDGYFYTLATRARLRGQIAQNFRVWEENSSGRAAFVWKPGTDYLLFASWSKRDRAWVIDGCGNSGPLGRSASVLAAIKSMNTSATDGLVEGMTSTGSWTTGVPDVTIRAIGNEKTFTAQTDHDGRFKMKLPVGRYRLEAIRSGWSFMRGYTYEDPADLTLIGGGCAQVHFSGAQDR